MEAIMITGGAGFIGANFVHQIATTNNNTPLIVVDKLSYAGNLANLEPWQDNGRIHFIKADIADRKTIQALFYKFKPGSLVNFAAETHVDRSIDDPSPFVHTNIVGTQVLLESARQYLADDSLKRDRFRFLHISTDEVYGSLGSIGAFTETTAYAPNSPYAASKAAADHLVQAYQVTYGLPTLITNCSNNYGPYQYPEKLIPLMVLNALQGRELPIYGDGGHIRDWLHVKDHCNGILSVLEKGRPGEKYNIGGNNEYTNLQIVDRICEVLEQILPAQENPALQQKKIGTYQKLQTFVKDRPGHDRRYAINADKIRQELGWQPQHSFDEGIAQTIRWYQHHGDWCQRVAGDRYNCQRLGLGNTK